MPFFWRFCESSEAVRECPFRTGYGRLTDDFNPNLLNVARRAWSAAMLFEAVIGCGSLNPCRLLADYLLACQPSIAQRCLCNSEYVFEILICARAQYGPNEIGAGAWRIATRNRGSRFGGRS